MFNNFKKKATANLVTYRKDFFDELGRIKTDMEQYHDAAFSKFVHLFHRTLISILASDKNLTLEEMVDYMKNLSSVVYNLNKQIKATEDEILKVKDKKQFSQLKEELDQLVDKKDYYALLEKNITKNSLVFKLKDISEKINKLTFSGEGFSKEEAQEITKESEDLIKKITAEENRETNNKWWKRAFLYLKSLFSERKAVKEERKKEQNFEKKEERKIGQAVVPMAERFHLTEDEKNYIRSQVSDEYYNKHIHPVIEFIDSLQGKHNLGDIEKAYREQVWRDEFELAFKLIYEAINKKNNASNKEARQGVIEDAHNFKLTEDEKNFIKSKVSEGFYNEHIKPVVDFIDSLDGKYSLGQIEKAYREQVWRDEFELTFRLIYDILHRRQQGSKS